VSGGELFTHLYQREHFTEEEVRIYVGEIILALEHLHKVSLELHFGARAHIPFPIRRLLLVDFPAAGAVGRGFVYVRG
jgi:hypothetical protein